MKKDGLLQCLFLTICTVLLFAAAGAQPGNADSILAGVDCVLMKNGDRLLGKISRVQRGDLYFDGDKTGDVKIDLRDLKALKGQRKLYRVDMINRGEYTGTIDFAGRDGFFMLCRMADSLVFRLDEISGLLGFEKTFLKRLDGDLQFGYSFTKSSDISRLNLSNELTYTSAKWQLGQGYSGIYTMGDGNGWERMDGTLKAIYDLRKRWIVLGALQYQRMLELGLQSRIMSVAGLGKKIIENRHVELQAATGLSGQKEYGTDGSVSAVQVELPLLVNFNLFQLKKPDIDIYSNAVFYYSFSVAGRYRLDYKLNYSYEIVRDFKIGFQFFYNYDSKPLAPGTGRSDIGTVFTLGYEF